MEINGKEIAQRILEALQHRVEILKTKHHIIPHLAVIRVGDDPTITSYVHQKEKTAQKIGAQVTVYQYPETVTEDELLKNIQRLDVDPTIHGVILQLPIPRRLDTQKLLFAISPEKDVDGFHPKSKFIVPIASAVETTLHTIFTASHLIKEKSFHAWLTAQTIAVIGKGKTGGKPMIDLLQSKHIHPIIIDSKTEHLEERMKKADIIISAAGKNQLVKRHMIKPGAILLSIGMTKGEDGKFYGDYDIDEIKDVAGFYTPVPGGIGPVNVAKLMENVVLAAEKTLQ